MIIVSAGMPKSGSAWFFNLTNDLVLAAGKQDIRAIREQFKLHSILQWENCNIGHLTFRKNLTLLRPYLAGNSFVVKTHDSPSKSLKFLLFWGIACVTYIYRDPRDVLISALEHGERIRKTGERSHVFAKLENFEMALDYVKGLLPNWNHWMKCRRLFHVRYEDLLEKPEIILIELADFLSLSVTSQHLRTIVQTYSPQELREDEKNMLHFNKGGVGRFREKLDRKQLDLCNEHFGPYLERMGYSIV
jgi:hypothetical protein